MRKKKNALENGKGVVTDADTCPFCKGYPEVVVMPGYRGFCALFQCVNKDCPVVVYTPMVEAKTQEDAIKKARDLWHTRARKRNQK